MIIDHIMLDTIIQSLFRLLMADLPVDQNRDTILFNSNPYMNCDSSFVKQKIDLLRVLKEVISFMEVLSQDEFQDKDLTNCFIVNLKFVNDSRVYIQIFIDLIKFISMQNEIEQLQREEFCSQVQELFELYLLKINMKPEILYTTFE